MQNLPTARPKRRITLNNKITGNSVLVRSANLLTDRSQETEHPNTDKDNDSSNLSRKNSLLEINRGGNKIDTSRSISDFDSRNKDILSP